MKNDAKMEIPLTPEESEWITKEKARSLEAESAYVNLGLLRRDFDEAIPFPGIRIPPGGEVSLSITPKRSCFPKRLYVPKEMADRIEVTNIIVVNKGEEIPLFDGSRVFAAELFDGMKVVSPEHPEGGPRRRPYGLLPRILHDAGRKVVLRVRNPHPVDKPFTAVLALEYPFPEQAKE